MEASSFIAVLEQWCYIDYGIFVHYVQIHIHRSNLAPRPRGCRSSSVQMRCVVSGKNSSSSVLHLEMTDHLSIVDLYFVLLRKERRVRRGGRIAAFLKISN
jgi:hypothetical protein